MSKDTKQDELKQEEPKQPELEQGKPKQEEPKQEEPKQEEASAAQKEKNPFEETVRIKLPIIKGERSDVMVGVNGKFWQIKRGVYVDIPLPVYEVLLHQEEMELQASMLEEQLAAQLEQMKS